MGRLRASPLAAALLAAALCALAGAVEVRSAGDYAAAAARIGVGENLDEGSVAAVARALGVDAVITGVLERQGAGYKLRLRVLRGREPPRVWQ